MANAKQPLAGKTLRMLRLMKGMKQSVVAKNAGISQQYYSRIESGKSISEEKYQQILFLNNYTTEDVQRAVSSL